MSADLPCSFGLRVSDVARDDPSRSTSGTTRSVSRASGVRTPSTGGPAAKEETVACGPQYPTVTMPTLVDVGAAARRRSSYRLRTSPT